MYSDTFTFCPNCGAVTVNKGTCTNCGFNFGEEKEDFSDLEQDVIYDDLSKMDKTVVNPSMPKSENEVHMTHDLPKKKSGGGAGKVVLIIAIILLILIVFLPIIFVCLMIFIGILAPVIIRIFALNGYNSGGYSNPTTSSGYTYSYDYDYDDDDLYDYDYDYDDDTDSGNGSGYITAFIARDLFELDEEINFDDYTVDADVYDYENNLSRDIYYQNQYFLHVPSGHYNMDPNSYVGPYYDSFSECFVPLYGYNVDRKYVQFSGEISSQISMNAYVGYYALKDTGLANEDEINEQIYETVMYGVYDTIEGINNGDVDEKLYVYTDSTITYNDDVKMSIIVDTVICDADNNIVDTYLNAINIDLRDGGKIIDYQDLVELDDNIGETFATISEDQNGYSDVVNGYLTHDDITDILRLSNSSIAFFTPIGLELGINYCDADTGEIVGWTTVSIMEYNDYVKEPYKDADSSQGLSTHRYDYDLNNQAPVISDDGEEL